MLSHLPNVIESVGANVKNAYASDVNEKNGRDVATANKLPAKYDVVKKRDVFTFFHVNSKYLILFFLDVERNFVAYVQSFFSFCL